MAVMRPLSGVRVVDASGYLAGPFTTLMLSDLGADVVKVEAPKGDPLRRFGYRLPGTDVGVTFAAINRDKRGVIVDLHTDEGRDTLFALLADADVFVQNWRPGVAERLGLTDAALETCNPRLLHVGITGYGPTGPDANTPAFDTVMQAHTALCTTHGGGEPPRLIGTYLADKVTSLMAAQAIVAGLLGRERGLGTGRIDVSMLDSVAYFGAPDLLETRTAVRDTYADPARIPPSDTLVGCLDGHVVVAPTSGVQIRRAFAALGHPEWAEQLRAIRSAGALAEKLMELLGAATANLAVADCLARLAEHDVPAAEVMDLDGHLAHPQVAHNGTYPQYQDQYLGTARRVRYPGVCAGWSAPPVSQGAPGLGEHSGEILGAPVGQST